MVAILSKFTVVSNFLFFLFIFLKLKLILFDNSILYYYTRIFLILLLHPVMSKKNEYILFSCIIPTLFLWVKNEYILFSCTRCSSITSQILNYHLCSTSELRQVVMLLTTFLDMSVTLTAWISAHHAYTIETFFKTIESEIATQEFFIRIFYTDIDHWKEVN